MVTYGMQVEQTQHVIKRMTEISLLDEGWLDGEGEVIDGSSNRLAVHVTFLLIREGVFTGMPHLYPTIDGHVQLEFIDGSRGIDVKFVKDKIEIGMSDISTGAHSEHVIDARPFGLEQLNQLIGLLALGQKEAQP